MKLFDLHCDTAYEIFRQNKSIEDNNLHISIEKAKNIEVYKQVFAIWCDFDIDDEPCYGDFLNIYGNLTKQLKISTGESSEDRVFYLSLEDARLLNGDIERLNLLYEMGVRFLIPVWKGISCIGGAFNTNDGLTDFGKEVINRCFELGIVPDISHSSVETADEILTLGEKLSKPVIASHSCAFSVFEHPRNLRDEQFLRIKDLGGVVGLSFCKYHLASENVDCDRISVFEHIAHYLSIGGEDILCFGADMDGAPMPNGISGIGDFPSLYGDIVSNFGKIIADKITYTNANNFVKTNLK